MMHTYLIEWYHQTRGFVRQVAIAATPYDAVRVGILADLYADPEAAARLNDHEDITAAGYKLHRIEQIKELVCPPLQ